MMFNRQNHDLDMASKLGSDGMTAIFFTLFITVTSFIGAVVFFGEYVHQTILLTGSIILGGFVGLKSFLYIKQKRASEAETARNLKQASIDQEREKQLAAMRTEERKNAKY